jgi:hypothetical protein
MADDLEALLAKQAITEALYRYCHGVDRIDPDLANIWHPDGQAIYTGMFEGTGTEFVDWVLPTHEACDATSHQVTNMLIEVDGDRAISETYVHACVRVGGNDILVWGRYADSWSRRDGRWAVDVRRVTIDVQNVVPVAGD